MFMQKLVSTLCLMQYIHANMYHARSEHVEYCEFDFVASVDATRVGTKGRVEARSVREVLALFMFEIETDFLAA